MSSLNDIKQQLRKYNLSVYGNKQECRDRLFNFLEENRSDSSDSDSEYGGCCGCEGGSLNKSLSIQRAQLFDHEDFINYKDDVSRGSQYLFHMNDGEASIKQKIKVLDEVYTRLKKYYKSILKYDTLNYDTNLSDCEILPFIIHDLKSFI